MLPWQMNSIFIIVLFLLVLPRKALPRLSSRSRQSQNARLCKHIGHFARCFAYFARDFGDFAMFLILLWNYRLWQIRARLSKLVLPVSSKIGSNTSKSYYLECYTKFYKKKEPDASGSPRCNPKTSTAILIYNILLLHKICKNFMIC